MVPLGVAAALLAAVSASETRAAELFEPPTGQQEPRPLFGPGVQGLYEDARTRIFEPARIAAAQMLGNPATQAAIDRASGTIRQFAETVNADLARTAEAIESFLSRPEVDHSIKAAEASARRLRVALRRRVVEPWMRAAEETLVAPEGATAHVDAEGALSPAAPIFMAAPPRVPGGDGTGGFEDNDPLEPINRAMFSLNNGLQMTVMEPVSNFYIRSTTPPVRNGMRNFFANLREPVTVVSNLIEGRLDGAGNATARFGINTVLGIAGVLDPAAQMGFSAAPRNLEHTLCAFGLAPGPYVVLPILGPATVRDSVGRIATVVAYFQVMGATIYIPYRLTDITLQYADRRDRMRSVSAMSIDPYVAHRALYLATRTLTCGDQAKADQELFTR